MPLLETKGVASAQGFGFSLQRAGAVQAEAIDFDGTNDFLSRSTDLVGNVNGNTFTFSVWVWRGNQNLQYIYNSCESSTSTRFSVELTGSSGNNAVRVIGKNTSGSTIFSVTSALVVGLQTWTSVIVSGNNNTNVLDIAINDVRERISDAFTSTNSIAFAQPIHNVAQFNGDEMQTRLSNVFLDYTYRDLSVTANRRLFVTADLKPAAGQAALNPILYLPMSDPTNPGLNQGTGGNFTLTGVVARSGRGPNQYNAPYSTFDGSTDYLSRSTAPTGIANGRTFTVSLVLQRNGGTGNERIIELTTGGSSRFEIKYNGTSTIEIFAGGTAGGNTVLAANFTAPTMVVGRNYVLTISIDLANTSNRHVFFNGEAASVTWSTYVNSNIEFAPASPEWAVGASIPAGPGRFYNGQLGALWFNTSYINLSVPANLAKFVTGTGINAAPVDLGATGELPTGTSPLIYLPMYGNNAGQNYGTGGNFTFNSGPYTGARGPNEFWGNRASFNGSTTYLARTSGVGASDGKTFSLSLWFNPTANESGDSIFNIGPDEKFLVRRDTSNQFNIFAFSPSGTALNVTTNSTIATDNTWYHVLVCVDLSNTAKRFIYINGTLFASTWSTYSSTINFNFSASNYTIGGLWNGSSYPSASVFDGGIAELYFTTTYIDFSQEAERLKFRNAFGNPVNLPQQIEALAIPNPAIYMRFPPTSFGTNSGTGGNFTVNGTITDGGQL